MVRRKERATPWWMRPPLHFAPNFPQQRANRARAALHPVLDNHFGRRCLGPPVDLYYIDAVSGELQELVGKVEREARIMRRYLGKRPPLRTNSKAKPAMSATRSVRSALRLRLG